MPETIRQAVKLNELAPGAQADLFLVLTSKQEQTTRDGKPFFRVGFRDATMEVRFPIWNDSKWFSACDSSWTPGEFYKVRAVLQQTKYGTQLDIHNIRPVEPADQADGFDPAMCLPRSRFDPEEMFAELLSIAREEIGEVALVALIEEIFTTHHDELLVLPSATRNHHAFMGGFLEHVLSVTRSCVFLAAKYDDYYADMVPRLNRDVVVAGAILHDIGKLRELEQRPEGAAYTAEGHLLGHMLQGRDIVREAAAARQVHRETLLRLEHVVVAHQRLPEWGAPKPPMTPEALIVHYADDLDAKYHMIAKVLAAATGDGPMVLDRNPLDHPIFRGWGEEKD